MRLMLEPLKHPTPIPCDVSVTRCRPAACEGSEPLDAEPWPTPTSEQRCENGAD